MKLPKIRSKRPRGFTLVELLAGIVIIALLAAMATPSFIAMVRDRRVARAGQIIADTYREARAESLRRGIAVIVRWRPANARGSLEIREAVVQPAGASVTKGCTTADWSTGSAEARTVATVNLDIPQYELADIVLLDETNNSASFADVCFGADGRTYRTYIEGDPPAPLAGVPHFEIKNTQTAALRRVFVPPNGVARMQL